jgi:hypothetical protein
VSDRVAAYELLYTTDAHQREFDSDVVAVDESTHAVALAATFFFPPEAVSQTTSERSTSPPARRSHHAYASCKVYAEAEQCARRPLPPQPVGATAS